MVITPLTILNLMKMIPLHRNKPSRLLAAPD